MWKQKELEQTNNTFGGNSMQKAEFMEVPANLESRKRGLVKPVTFGNPNGSGQARFFASNGREKPFILGNPDSEESYTIVGENGKAKTVYIPNTYADVGNRVSEANKEGGTAQKPKEVEAMADTQKPDTQKPDTKKPITFAELIGLNVTPNMALGTAVEDRNPAIQSNIPIHGMYNPSGQQGGMFYGNQINDVPAVGQPNVVAQNMTDTELQPQTGTRQNYIDRVQRIQQSLSVVNGAVTTNQAIEASRADCQQQASGKRAYERAEVQFTNDGHWQITVSYSGFQKCAVMEQVWGRYQIFKLEYENDPSKDRKFQITFENGITVLGKQKGLKKDALYEYFIGAGVDMKAGKLSELPEKAVKEALYGFFKNQIENASKITIDGRAGWLKGTWNWLCTENNLYTDREVVPKLPIMNKTFWTKKVGEIDRNWVNVFELYREIPNEAYRILFIEMLVGGVLSSKLEKASNKFFLNLVLTEGMQIEPLCKLFQVFNRERIECYELGGREKTENYLKNTKDQVLILHTTGSVSQYKLQQECDRLNQIVEAVCYGAGYGSIVVINSERTDREDGINILLDSSFITERISELLKQDVVGDFLQKFILWVMNRECGQPQVENILHTVTCKSSVLDIVRQILEVFCKSQGLDLYKMLGTSEETAQEINANPLGMENELSVSDIIETIRTQIRAFHMENRGKKKYAEDTCYCDTETIWIPITIMNRVFELGEISDKAGALKALKQDKILLGKNKLTTRITVGDQQLECYRMKLSALNSRGKVELASLGKEIK